MSGKDDPFSSAGKTVIRPRPGGVARPNAPTPATPTPGVAPIPPIRQPAAAPTPPPQVNRSPISPRPSVNPALPGGGMGVPENVSNDWMRGAGSSQPAFPDALQPAEAAPVAQQIKIPLEVALNARDGADIPSSNPMTTAAASLLILLGRLRLLIVDMNAVPLMNHVAGSITEFERRALEIGIPKDDVMVAKYALCATADDIVQNLPGTDRHVWMQYSMLAQFFQTRTSGVGFFEELNKVLANPAAHYDLLELMHACMSLGFEGQYRSAAGGDVELSRIRRDVYQTLRHLKSRSDEDISPRWRGMDLGLRDLGSAIPIWAIACFSAVLLFGVYILLRILLANDTAALASTLVELHPRDAVTIERATFKPLKTELFEPKTGQLERIRAALKPEIDKGVIAVDPVGEYIVMNVSNLILFGSGKWEVKKAFEPIGKRIAEALEKEPGQIFVTGHTDSVKPSRTSRFKSNFDLSVARATSVKEALAHGLSDPSRLIVKGKGSDEPVATNKTREGRAKNRRVEVVLPREETIESADAGVPIIGGSN